MNKVHRVKQTLEKISKKFLGKFRSEKGTSSWVENQETRLGTILWRNPEAPLGWCKS